MFWLRKTSILYLLSRLFWGIFYEMSWESLREINEVGVHFNNDLGIRTLTP